MPKAKRYTEKRFVMLTPAQARQLERLSQHQEVSVPELIRTALRQHYSPGRRNPTVSRGCTIPRDVRNRGDAGVESFGAAQRPVSRGRVRLAVGAAAHSRAAGPDDPRAWGSRRRCREPHHPSAEERS